MPSPPKPPSGGPPGTNASNDNKMGHQKARPVAPSPSTGPRSKPLIPFPLRCRQLLPVVSDPLTRWQQEQDEIFGHLTRNMLGGRVRLRMMVPGQASREEEAPNTITTTTIGGEPHPSSPVQLFPSNLDNLPQQHDTESPGARILLYSASAPIQDLEHEHIRLYHVPSCGSGSVLEKKKIHAGAESDAQAPYLLSPPVPLMMDWYVYLDWLVDPVLVSLRWLADMLLLAGGREEEILSASGVGQGPVGGVGGAGGSPWPARPATFRHARLASSTKSASPAGSSGETLLDTPHNVLSNSSPISYENDPDDSAYDADQSESVSNDDQEASGSGNDSDSSDGGAELLNSMLPGEDSDGSSDQSDGGALLSVVLSSEDETLDNDRSEADKDQRSHGSDPSHPGFVNDRHRQQSQYVVQGNSGRTVVAVQTIALPHRRPTEIMSSFRPTIPLGVRVEAVDDTSPEYLSTVLFYKRAAARMQARAQEIMRNRSAASSYSDSTSIGRSQAREQQTGGVEEQRLQHPYISEKERTAEFHTGSFNSDRHRRHYESELPSVEVASASCPSSLHLPPAAPSPATTSGSSSSRSVLAHKPSALPPRAIPQHGQEPQGTYRFPVGTLVTQFPHSGTPTTTTTPGDNTSGDTTSGNSTTTGETTIIETSTPGDATPEDTTAGDIFTGTSTPENTIAIIGTPLATISTTPKDTTTTTAIPTPSSSSPRSSRLGPFPLSPSTVDLLTSSEASLERLTTPIFHPAAGQNRLRRHESESRAQILQTQWQGQDVRVQIQDVRAQIQDALAGEIQEAGPSSWTDIDLSTAKTKQGANKTKETDEEEGDSDWEIIHKPTDEFITIPHPGKGNNYARNGGFGRREYPDVNSGDEDDLEGEMLCIECGEVFDRTAANDEDAEDEGRHQNRHRTCAQTKIWNKTQSQMQTQSRTRTENQTARQMVRPMLTSMPQFHRNLDQMTMGSGIWSTPTRQTTQLAASTLTSQLQEAASTLLSSSPPAESGPSSSVQGGSHLPQPSRSQPPVPRDMWASPPPCPPPPDLYTMILLGEEDLEAEFEAREREKQLRKAKGKEKWEPTPNATDQAMEMQHETGKEGAAQSPPPVGSSFELPCGRPSQSDYQIHVQGQDQGRILEREGGGGGGGGAKE